MHSVTGRVASYARVTGGTIVVPRGPPRATLPGTERTLPEPGHSTGNEHDRHPRRRLDSRAEVIGIDDVGRAWQGGDSVIALDEMPVFWACGVTLQVAVRSARPPIAITHTPAHMLVTDVRNASLAVG